MGWFLLNAGALVVLGSLGLIVGRRRRRVWLPVTVAATVLVLIQAGLHWRADLAAVLFPWIGYPLVENWHVPVCIFGLAALGRQLPRRRTRRVVAAGTLVIVAYGLWSPAMAFLVSFDDLTGAPNGAGFCAQTSNYSCGPAALATWLAQLGVRCTEREAARLSRTQRYTGATALGVWRGARLKLGNSPRSTAVRRLSWDDLRRLRHPCVIVVRYSLLTDHFVTVLGVEGDRVMVADPLVGGAGVWSRAELERRWRRLAIVAEPARR